MISRKLFAAQRKCSGARDTGIVARSCDVYRRLSHVAIIVVILHTYITMWNGCCVCALALGIRVQNIKFVYLGRRET